MHDVNSKGTDVVEERRSQDGPLVDVIGASLIRRSAAFPLAVGDRCRVHRTGTNRDVRGTERGAAH